MKKFAIKFVTKKSFRFLIAKKIVALLVLFNVVSLSVAGPYTAYAQPFLGPVSGSGYPVSDVGSYGWFQDLIFGQNFQTTQDQAISAEELAERNAREATKTAVFVALTESLDYFLNTLAYDTATWIASGGEGQQPLFYTQGWGDYLADLADGAGGKFIESIGKDFLNINVCNPSASLKLSIGLGLSEIQRPSKPNCSLSKIIDNFDTIASDPNFLDRVSVVFDPQQNDIGIAATVYGRYFEAQAEAVEEGTKEREDGPFKNLTSKISGFIKTPGSIAEDRIKALGNQATDLEIAKVKFGNVALTSIQTFINTLAGGLFQKILKEGLADDPGRSGSGSSFGRGLLNGLSLFGNNNDNNQDLFSPDSAAGFGGRQTAQLRFIDFFNASNEGTSPYDILTKLTFCPDPENPGPEDCVIKPEFRTAVDQNLTVREAIEAELLDGDAPFGSFNFNSKSIYEGMPYRSIVILRVHRIVPVGWELAAEIINQFEPEKQYSLNDLINLYDDDSPDNYYYRLVDPDWVLAAPAHICTAEGFGPQIIFEQNIGGVDGNGDGDFNDPTDQQPKRQIGRAEYCADVQTCIEENSDGSCKYYGYCNEERRVWDLQGASCEPAFNTCQTFQSSSGEVVSYLANTLDYDGCSLDNAGCMWYCQEYNPVDDIWTCLSEGEDVLKPCATAGGCNLSASCTLQEGEDLCSDSAIQVNLQLEQACNSGSQFWNGTECVVQTGCTIAQGGVSCQTSSCDVLDNLLPNSSFETATFGQVAQGWTTPSPNYFERVSGASERVFDGTSSLRFYSAGGNNTYYTISDPISLSAGTYTFSGYVYDSLNSGNVRFSIYSPSGAINDNPTIIINQEKNSWNQLSKDFTVNTSADDIEIIIYAAGNPINGTAWFDNLRITQSCIANSVELTLIGAVDQNESKIHFDNDVVGCDASNDGCSEFIRLQPGLGTNLVKNSNFENWSISGSPPPGWDFGDDWNNHQFTRVVTSTSPASETVLQLNNNTGDRIFETTPIVGMKSDSYYRVSFWAKSDQVVSSDQWYSQILANSNSGSNSTDLLVNGTKEIPVTSQWTRFVFDVLKTQVNTFDHQLSINNASNDQSYSIYIDGVQIEEVTVNNDLSTSYKDYGSSNVINLKKPPSYLNCIGDPATDPDECSNYAFACEENEVGCQAYQPLLGGPSVPGVVDITDYCGVECVGYQAYKQSSTFFEEQESLEYFIPATAQQCRAAAVGCDEFTNLDEVAAGGEGLGYYQYLRQCELPEEANCGNFFTWQGSDETGFQLQVNSLVKDGDNPRHAITGTLPEVWGNCDDAQDVLVNPFCRELIDINGNVYYEILDNTISCSADCHPFRKTNLGEDPGIAQANCASSYGDWQDGSCVYKAIPGQGIQCNAVEAGCREYKGNAGANIFTVFSDNFEDGDIVNWSLGANSSESLDVGGHSIASASGIRQIATSYGTLSGVCSDSLPECADGDINCFDSDLGYCVAQDITPGASSQTCLVAPGDQYCGVIDNIMSVGKTYLLSFWGKANDGSNFSNIDIRLGYTDSGSQYSLIDNITLSPDWNYYKVGPFTYDEVNNQGSSRLWFYSPTPNSIKFNLDNINIQEVNSYSYVIRNSWNTPASCDTNPFVQPPVSAPGFMLGCEQYSDTYGRVHNLKSFDYLCREVAVGCEALIDTHNSTNAFGQVFNANDPLSQIDVPEDSLIYLTNRPEFACDGFAKGCQAVGLPALDDDLNVVDNQTLYLINDPDQYNSILCESDEVFCEEFQTNNGFAYFKDPQGRTCEYRLIPGSNEFSWFKTGSSSSEPDCPLVQPSIGEPHPNGLVGICPAQLNSCTQFIDPITADGKSLILNQSFNIDVDDNQLPDYWTIDNDSGYSVMTQNIYLEANKAYTVSFEGDADLLRNDDAGLIIEIQNCSEVKSFDGSLIESGSCFDAAGNIEQDPSQIHCSTNADCNAGYVCLDGLRLPPTYYKDDTRKNPFDSDFDPNDHLPVPGFTKEPGYSGRFSVPVDRVCSLSVSINLNTVGHIYCSNGTDTDGDNKIDCDDDKPDRISNISVREAGTYYVLSDTVDKTSCNGIVDESNGCVMFNDRSFVNYKISEDDSSYLRFDADNSNFSTNNGIPVQNCSGVCDSNTVLKVEPDRVCEAWLYCNSYIQVVDEDGVTKTYCSDLGQCKDLNPDGTCKRPLLLNGVTDSGGDTRLDHYTDREQIKNLSGYVNPGLNLGAGFSIIQGMFPYAETSERGSNARVANGEFESSFGDTAEPIGWSSPDTGMTGVCSTTGLLCDGSCAGICDENKLVPVQYHDYKFSIQKDFRTSVSGAGYLRLNTFYEAISEEIDVEAGNEYILTAKVNTQFLEHNSQDQKAEILIQVLDESNNVINLGSGLNCSTVPGYNGADLWNRCNGLMVDNGLPWQDVVFSIDLGEIPTSTPKKMKLKLSNTLYDPANPSYTDPTTNGCYGYQRHSFASSCELGGYSLFDSVSLKSVLEVNNNPAQNNFISRTCRIYPTGDALSCEFSDGDEFFFGKYGYCLTTDPNNPNQCLQWLPIDQISGETLDEVTSGYNDRFPLYYCTDNQSTEFKISDGAAIVKIGNRHKSFVGDLVTDSGQAVEVVPFNVLDDYRAVFRYPYIDQLSFSGSVLGIGGDFDGAGAGFTSFDLNATVDGWEDYGAFTFAIPTVEIGDIVVYIGFFLPIGWDNAINETLVSLLNLCNEQVFDGNLGNIVCGPSVGVRVVTDTDPEFAGSIEDPLPDVDGDILGLAWFVRNTSSEISLTVNFNVEGSFDINYCNELVRTVTSAGDNKGYANRLSGGAGYVLEDYISNPPFGAKDRDYVYNNPFDYYSFLNYFSTYNSSDYAPFGALVQPADSQDPSSWDSKEGGTRQPLLYEPPRTEAFDKPYQARMGEPHTPGSLQRIFAKSYGYWHWEWRDISNIALGGSYRKGASVSPPDGWSTPAPGVNPECGDERGDDYCYIRPVIDPTLIRVDDKGSVVIPSGTGTVKLDFNVVVDSDQLPLTSYSVDWGDGKSSVISGVVLRNRANEENPFSMFHLYDFWEMVRTFTGDGAPDLTCVDSNSDGNYDYCQSKAKLRASDNWGISTDDGSGSPWITMPGTIRVLRP